MSDPTDIDATDAPEVKKNLDAQLYGHDLFGEVMKPTASGIVAERFGFPPFTVFDSRNGDWQKKKRAWASIGITSGEGREKGLVYNCVMKRLTGYKLKPGEVQKEDELDKNSSLFDPVLCECIYRWFCIEGGQIVDPFCGGSVRGIVAGALGRKYWGVDLRQEQVDANNEQTDVIELPVYPKWVVGDSTVMIPQGPEADLIFSCPPYGDLEKYSDKPEDLSAMKWEDFVIAYKKIIALSVEKLKPNRFACFVVGDFRDPKGYYRNFVALTTEAFLEAGCGFYNDAILLNVVGSASMRVTKQFDSGRKFCKIHQNILVFCKGDWKKAAEFCNRGEGKIDELAQD